MRESGLEGRGEVESVGKIAGLDAVHDHTGRKFVQTTRQLDSVGHSPMMGRAAKDRVG